jgi:hypothetical protein
VPRDAITSPSAERELVRDTARRELFAEESRDATEDATDSRNAEELERRLSSADMFARPDATTEKLNAAAPREFAEEDAEELALPPEREESFCAS